MEQKQILTSAKGGKSNAYLQKMTLYNTNIDLVNDNVYTNVLKIWSKTQVFTSIQFRNSVANFCKMMLHNPNIVLATIMYLQIFVKCCPAILKIFGKNQILKSIKCHDSVANFQK